VAFDTRDAERFCHHFRQTKWHKLGNFQLQATVKAHVVVDMYHLAGASIAQDVVQMTITQTDHKSNDTHHGN
jgi:hypothetical protein